MIIEYILPLDDYDDFYRLRSLLLRVAEHGGPFLSAHDQAVAKKYAERIMSCALLDAPLTKESA